jgi:alkylation response protein AidB-like acyl-CoA dehydrogenase
MGVSMLVIGRHMKGVKTKQLNCSGVWASGTAYITFEDVIVPAKYLIGEENQGFKYIMYNFNHERWAMAAQATRFARVCLEESIKYAIKRRTFGKPLIQHQVIRHKLAEMASRVESTWSWLESITYQLTIMDRKTASYQLSGSVALIKAQSSRVLEYCAREAQQIFGGLGYTRGGQGEKVERLAREVRAYAVPAGSEEIMLDLGTKIAEKQSRMVQKMVKKMASRM